MKNSNKLILVSLAACNALFAEHYVTQDLNENTINLFLNAQKEPSKFDTKTQTITLQELIKHRINSNETIKSLKQEVEIARNNLKIAENSWLPTLDYSIEYSNAKNFDNRAEDAYEEFSEENKTKSSLDLNWNLYKGGATYASKKIADLNLRIAENKLKQAYENEILKLTGVYIELYYMSLKIAESQKTLDVLEKLMIITEKKTEAGLVSKGDLKNIKANYYNQKSQHINYISTKYEKESYFEFLAGEDLKNFSPTEIKMDFSLEKVPDLLLKLYKNSKIEAALLDIKTSKEERGLAKSKFLPEVNFGASYNSNLIVPNDLDNSSVADTNQFSSKLEFKWNLFNKTKDEKEYLNSFKKITATKFKLENLKRELSYQIKSDYLKADSITRSLKNKEYELTNIDQMLANFWSLYDSGQNMVKQLLDGEKSRLKTVMELIASKESNIKTFFNIKKNVGELVTFFDVDFKAYGPNTKIPDNFSYSFGKDEKVGQNIIPLDEYNGKKVTTTDAIDQSKKILDEIDKTVEPSSKSYSREDIRKMLDGLSDKNNAIIDENDDNVVLEIESNKEDLELNKDDILKKIQLYK